MKAYEAERIFELLADKKSLFNELLTLSHKQTQWIQEENWTRLHNAINAKKARIDKIDHLDALYCKLISAETKAEKANEAAIQKWNQEIERIADEIVQIEQENIESIQKTMQSQKKELKEIQFKKKVNHAYSGKPKNQGSGSYLDKFK